MANDGLLKGVIAVSALQQSDESWEGGFVSKQDKVTPSEFIQKVRVWWPPTCNPRTGEMETERSPNSLASNPS